MAQKDIKLSDLTASLKKLEEFFKKHISIMFVIIVLAALVYSVNTVRLILATDSDIEYRDQKESETTSTQFDRTTIQKIEALGDRANPPEPVIPGGRINPFAE